LQDTAAGDRDLAMAPLSADERLSFWIFFLNLAGI
jgi:hypothetical protein